MMVSIFGLIQATLFPGMASIFMMPFITIPMLFVGVHSYDVHTSDLQSPDTAAISMNSESSEPLVSIATNPETIAKCLNEKGVKFYGAYWCPHCQEQKESFGSAAQYLPYIECDAKGENPNPEACEKANIKAYPTWVFPDGTTLTGVQHPDDLSYMARCEE